MAQLEIKSQSTEVSLLHKLPGPKRLAQPLGFTPEVFLVVYDKKMASNLEVKSWLKEFRFVYPVTAGEKLKNIEDLPSHLRKMMKVLGAVSPKSMCIVAVGGGTVGDFAGFIASIYKRGVPLIQVPTTFLAAMDSAHGGKTALNMGAIKNQIGSFHSAKSVVIVKDLLSSLPKAQMQSAVGELFKMALIDGGELYEKVKSEGIDQFETIWNLLPLVIAAKYRVIEKDPLEQSGERQVLNLGHSLGHVLESYYNLAHGLAVGMGLNFAVRWSQHRGYLKPDAAQEILDLLHGPLAIQSPEDFFKSNRKMSRSKLETLIAQDKKLKDSAHLNFIFLDKVGGSFRKSITLESFLTEAERQGWLK